MNDANDKQAYRKAISRAADGDQTVAPLEAPRIDDALVADKTDMTVRSSYLLDDSLTFALSIVLWPNLAPPAPGVVDTLTVTRVQSNKVVFTDDYNQTNAGEFPLRLDFPRPQVDEWGEGDNTFNYEVLSYNGESSLSQDLVLKFDRFAPYRTSSPEKFPLITDVTDSNIGTVTLQLPSYADRANGDTVYWFWLKDLPDNPTQVQPSGSAKVESNLPQAITVPADVIRTVGDGGVYVLYALEDKAGNISRLSVYTEVGVAIGPLPSNLKPPQVPTVTAGLVTQEDVFNGVQVHVPSFDNFKATDQIRVVWNGAAQPWREVGDAGVFPQVFDISGATVWNSYGDSSTGNVEIEVAYEVRRGTVPQGGQAIQVDVNLERIGPVNPGPDPDPDWPGPINPRLPEPEVYGEVSDTLNELLPADEYKDASLVVLVDATLREGDVLAFYWNDMHLDTLDYLLVADDIGEELTRVVPWDAIKAQGNGDIPVHYRVSRSGNPNSALSRDVTVAVSAIGIHPDKPEFLGGNTGAPVGWLTCRALYDDAAPSPLDPAIRVQVPDLAQYGLAVGDKVTLHWTAVHGFTGDTLIPGIDLDKEIELTTANLNGFVWRVQPYDTHILPIYEFDQSAMPVRDGRGRVHYTFTLAGKAYTSDVEERIVSMHNATGPCPLRPGP
ncbi:hypothetical protein ACQKO6_02625 [Pseudomonas monteilii]|uniref:hypothetical protein n=1 Tax=Pseudomonas alabamensis TaxID=3064349 RepID=UPI0027139A0D|nr:hypothetical protein [Pseudomonas sp. 22-AL-CL-001]MDO7912670.1 hypothetical protein [Pseudomonas sp. 22-AL-CL-001]